jgi:hypothetical protein
MLEGHALLERQEPVRRVDREERDAEALAGAVQKQRIADGLGRRDEQQTSRGLRQRVESPDVAALDPLRYVAGARDPETAGQLRRGQPPGQLDQRERIPPRLRENPVAHRPVEHEPHRRAQQRTGVPVDEAVHLELRQMPKLLAGVSRREHETHGLGQDPASDEPEGQGRGAIEPLRVVDDAQQRTVLAHLGHEAEHREADEEGIRRRPTGQAEDDLQRIALWPRQPLEPIEQRGAELLQAGEGQLHLGLDPHRPGDGQVGRRLDEMLQQHRLPDPGLAPQDQRPALTPADGIDQVVEPGALVRPPEERRRHAPRPPNPLSVERDDTRQPSQDRPPVASPRPPGADQGETRGHTGATGAGDLEAGRRPTPRCREACERRSS